MHSGWQAVIGLEIHAQLKTQSKLFSSAPNRFGDEPNENISVVCTGQPGALPVLNEQAVKGAVLFGLAIGSQIQKVTHFDRKSYFYPDSPRNFQITQFETPILLGGRILTSVGGESKTFQIKEAHIEDDAGMLKHFSTFTGIDYNRAGTPLIEIVSEPCMHTPQEAASYAMAVRSILLYLGVCDGNMEEGSLRMDANISVRRVGEPTLRPRIEIKNMNSFTFMEMALSFEIERQIDLYTRHPNTPYLELIPPGTYRFDPQSKQTLLMRAKESSDDYRYFPEPDLPPLILSQEWIDELRSQLPELPEERFRRYVSDLNLTEYAASLLVHDKPLADYFEQALALHPNAKLLCNWITVEFVGRFKDKEETFLTSGILPEYLAQLVRLIDEGRITARMAKSIADEMVASPNIAPETLIESNPDYQPVQDPSAVEAAVDAVLEENPQSILDIRNGKDKAFAFLVGSVMKKTRGKAPPHLVNELLRKKLQN